MHRVKGVVESTSKYYDVGYACNSSTEAHHLQKQFDSIKGGPCSVPLTPGNDANRDLHCVPCISLCPLSGTYKVEKPNLKKKDYLQRDGLNFSIFPFKNKLSFQEYNFILQFSHYIYFRSHREIPY